MAIISQVSKAGYWADETTMTDTMRRIVYYVATSLDGFICGLNDDISGFVGKGNGVDKYLEDLTNYDTVIMGKNTYKFGYKFGLKTGNGLTHI